MNPMYFYNLVQPYVETGYYIADMFLKKYTWHTEIINGIPFCTDTKSCRICDDLKLENFGYKKRESTISLEEELVMIDTDSFVSTEYYEIDRLIASILILFSELYIKNRIWDVEAFQYGFSMRAPELSNIVFSKLFSKNFITSNTKRKKSKSIEMNPFWLKLLQIKQNYVYKYMNERGYDFDNYNLQEFDNAFNEIESLNCPNGIKIKLREYLAKYAVNINLCKGDISAFYEYLYELYHATKNQENKNIMKWYLELLINLTNNKNNLEILNNEIRKIKNYDEIKKIENNELYSVLSQNVTQSTEYKNLPCGRNIKRFFDEILWVALYGYSWDKETSTNIIELMDVCYKREKKVIMDCVDFIDKLIEIFMFHKHIHTLIFFKQAEMHFQLGNNIKSLFLLKAIIRVVNDSDVLLLMSKIYAKLGYNVKSDKCFEKYRKCLTTTFYDTAIDDLQPQIVICGDKSEVKIKYLSQFKYKNDIPFDSKKIKKKIIFPPRFLKAPIQINDVIGFAAYFLEEQHLGSMEIVAIEEVKKSDCKFKIPRDSNDRKKIYDSNRFLNNTISLEKMIF